MMMISVTFADPGCPHPCPAPPPEFFDDLGHRVGLRGEYVDLIRSEAGQRAATDPLANNQIDLIGQQRIDWHAVSMISFTAFSLPTQGPGLHAVGIDQQVKWRTTKVLAEP